MNPAFDRTTRALSTDRGMATAGLGLTLVLTMAWGLWAVLGQVTLYEVAERARLRADGVARLQAPVAAEVRSVPVALGDEVPAGAVLVELDGDDARAALAAAEARVASLEARIAAQDAARSASAEGRRASVSARGAALAAAQGLLDEARTREAEAAAELARLEALRAAGAVSAVELEAAQTEARARSARVRALQAEVAQSSGERALATLEGQVGAQRDDQDAHVLTAELASARAEVERQRRALEDRTVRAPVAGAVGELATLVPGQRLAAGATVAVVVPDEDLLVDAAFAPERAAGRLQAGQRARVRFVGAGGQGARRATVERVGSEVSAEGLVPVVLRLDDDAGLHHGLVAEVEVEVEAVAPWQLLVRAAGGGA